MCRVFRTTAVNPFNNFFFKGRHFFFWQSLPTSPSLPPERDENTYPKKKSHFLKNTTKKTSPIP